MVRGDNMKHYVLAVLFTAVSLFSKAQSQLASPETNFEKAKQLRYSQPDSSIVLLQRSYDQFLKKGDTLQAIETLLEMPYQFGQKVDYAKSYDGLWLALLLADDIKDNQIKASIYGRLGRLYSFYKKKEKAFEYLNIALNLKKELVKQGKATDASLINNYYLFCATYRELNEPTMARVYLDSCFLKYKGLPDQPELMYLNFEKSFILAKEKKPQEALALLKEIEPLFLKNRPSYLVLVYTYWGDVYKDLADLKTSEFYYKKALEMSETHKMHLDFSILVHEKLADIYVERKEFEKAFSSQKMAKDLDAQFFDSRSISNRPLLEIKDEFRLEKERQQRLIEKQRIEQLEQQDKILLLQRIILIGALVFLTIIGLVYLKQLRAKHKAEKQLIQKSKELEIHKAKELLELKNKELATSALQLVEKDEFLKEIKTKLKGENGTIKTAEINSVLKSISHSNQSNWEEFKLRFTSVNEEFYKKVTTQYPNLSQADQKICALIKLNFSSKEMARLLGISVESVHTTRYRLRKKMGLDRSVNLEDFICSL